MVEVDNSDVVGPRGLDLGFKRFYFTASVQVVLKSTCSHFCCLFFSLLFYLCFIITLSFSLISLSLSFFLKLFSKFQLLVRVLDFTSWEKEFTSFFGFSFYN